MAKNNQRLLVSIIIPTFNRDKPLRQCLWSLFRQTYRPYEIMVIDQSNKKFSSKDSFYHKYRDRFFLRCLDKPSIPKAINLGLRAVRGDIVLLVDDDILADKRLVERHLQNYRDKSIFGVVGRVVTDGQKEEPRFKNVGQIAPWGMVAGGYSSRIRQSVNNVIGCNVSFRKNLIGEVGLVDENFVGNALRWETDLALRIKRQGKSLIFDPLAEVIHLRAPTGGCRMDNRPQWFIDFFHNEAYFCFKWINWYWWPLFWLIRWLWFLRARSLIIPARGVYLGWQSFGRWKNENRS